MNKPRIRKALAAVTVAGLAAGMILMAAGCKSSSSCSGGSCSGTKKSDTTTKGSCSGGSCTGTKK